ncbi:MAG TPA: hypothetical protein ENO11_05110 [Desulfobacteraceae bacterium]|nr:hypothetical protein [Desulfobacteraceae bacterium]
MSSELRRSNRLTDFLPISVFIRNNIDDSQVTGPFSARIVDVSNHGACLLMTQVMMQSFHIFHSTREDESIDLVLHIKAPATAEPIDIKAKPVWLNAAKMDDIKVFKMGVDFVNTIDNDLLRTINKLTRDI